MTQHSRAEGIETISSFRVTALTALAMLAFAGNSLLCRLALQHAAIDAATFTSVRLVAGALTLALLVMVRGGTLARRGSWTSAFALFAYAAGFSFAYLNLTVATGALLLFGAVQATMIGTGLARGERLRPTALAGLLMAIAGLVGLLLPGLSAPPLVPALLMLGAGVAWGVYSLRGKGVSDPTEATAGNFLRTVPIALALSLATLSSQTFDRAGVIYAAASGAITSGIGYAIWYAALPSLKASTAGVVQLSVPAIATIGGLTLLGEPITLRVTLASAAILGGIACVVLGGRR